MATFKRMAALGAILLVLSALLAGVTYSTYRTATFEDRARSTVVTELDDATSTDLELLSMQVDYESEFPFSRPERVVLTVGHPPGVEVSGLADRLDGPLNDLARSPLRADRPVVVEVRYVSVERTADRMGVESSVGAPTPKAASLAPHGPGAGETTHTLI